MTTIHCPPALHEAYRDLCEESHQELVSALEALLNPQTDRQTAQLQGRLALLSATSHPRVAL